MPARRVALTAPPLDRLVRSVADLDRLLAGRPWRPRLWRPHPPARLSGHDEAFTDLWHLRAHQRPPWTVAGGAYEGFRIPVLRLREAAVDVATGAVMPRPGLISAESHQRWDPITGLVGAGDGARIDLAAACPAERLDGRLLPLGHHTMGNFAHWIGDALPVVLAVEAALQDGRLALLVPPLAAWQRRMLALLGVPSAAIRERPPGPVLCADLAWSSASSSLHIHQPGPALDAVYRRLAAAAPAAARTADAPRLVHISRERLAREHHRCLNEAALSAGLARLGFVAVHPQQLTIEQQVGAFARADVVAGVHGAGFANIGFAPAGCLVVDCAAPPQVVPWLYRTTARLGQRYVLYICEEPYGSRWRAADVGPGGDPAEDGPRGSFRVEVEPFLATVRAAMERAGIRPGP